MRTEMRAWTKEDEKQSCGKAMLIQESANLCHVSRELERLLVKMTESGFSEEKIRRHPAVVLYISRIEGFVEHDYLSFSKAYERCMEAGRELVVRENAREDEAWEREGYGRPGKRQC